MSTTPDASATPHGDTEAPPTTTTPPTDGTGDAPAQEPTGTDWKVEARKWEARAKENAAAKARLDEMEDAARTDLERANTRAEQAEKELTALRHDALRRDVADAAGLPATAWTRLVGSTREELEADAIAYRQELNGAPPPPRPETSQGRTRGGEAPTTREQLAQTLFGPRR
jgi:hypothetical protein